MDFSSFKLQFRWITKFIIVSTILIQRKSKWEVRTRQRPLQAQLIKLHSSSWGWVLAHLLWRSSGCVLWIRNKPSRIRPPQRVSTASRTCSCLCPRSWCPPLGPRSVKTLQNGCRPHPRPPSHAASPRANGSSPRWPTNSACLYIAVRDRDGDCCCDYNLSRRLLIRSRLSAESVVSVWLMQYEKRAGLQQLWRSSQKTVLVKLWTVLQLINDGS